MFSVSRTNSHTKPRIFVSHSHVDNLWSEQFVEALKSAGLDVWFDNQGMYVGAPWIHQIERELQYRDVFLLVLTPDAWASHWVQQEIGLALAQKKRIVTIVHKDTPQVQGFITTYHMLDAIGQDPQAAANGVFQELSVPLLPNPSPMPAEWPSTPSAGNPNGERVGTANPVQSAWTTRSRTLPSRERNPRKRLWKYAIGAFLTAMVVVATAVILSPFHNAPKHSAGSSPTSTPTPTPTPLYEVAWSGGMDGWSGASEYSAVGGHLFSNGNASCLGNDVACAVFAPYAPTTANYAIDAQIQITSVSPGASFGIWARATGDGLGGYILWDLPLSVNLPYAGTLELAQPTHANTPLAHDPFAPASGWHTYRIEVHGSQITARVDGTIVLQVDNSESMQPGRIGIVGGLVGISVRSFTVNAV